MRKIDVQLLQVEVEKNPDPFNFYLLLTLINGGEIGPDNPYCKNEAFISKLIGHFEEVEDFERCLELKKRLKSLTSKC